jgi:hypothetical protein
VNGTNTVVVADVTGDGVADLQVDLVGTSLGLTINDFLGVA